MSTVPNRFGLYLDAQLTVPQTGPLLAAQKDDGSSAPVEHVLYLGSPGDDAYLEAVAGNLQVEVTDADPGGGHAAGEITLALSAAGLDVNTPGAALDLGQSIIQPGPDNAIGIHIRIDDATGEAGEAIELGIRTSLFSVKPAA